MQALCDCEILRNATSIGFLATASRRFGHYSGQANESKRARVQDLDYFHVTLRALFFHRRKFLRSQVFTATQDSLTKPQVDEILQRLGLKENMRAEELTVEQIIELIEATRIASQGKSVTG